MSGGLLVNEDAESVRLRWFGELTVDAVKEGIRELAALPRKPHGWVDLLAVTGCPIAVRPLLVEFHRVVMERTERRVWIAASPKLRAMGTWIAHMESDAGLRVVATVPQGDAWLVSADQRLEPATRGIQDFLDWKRAQ
jgi:hypothetical protein